MDFHFRGRIYTLSWSDLIALPLGVGLAAYVLWQLVKWLRR